MLKETISLLTAWKGRKALLPYHVNVYSESSYVSGHRLES